MNDIPATVKIYSGFLTVIASLLAWIGNLMVLVVIILFKRLQNKPFVFLIGNLALSKLIISICYLPFFGLFISHYWPYWVFGKSMCIILTFIKDVNVTVITGVFFIMALHGYISIVIGREVSKKMVNASLCLLWLMVLCLNAIYGFEPDVKNNSTMTCRKITSEMLSKKQKYGIAINAATQIVFTLLAVLVSLKPAHQLWIQRKAIENVYSNIYKRKLHDLKLSLVFVSLGCTFLFLNWIMVFAKLQRSSSINTSIIIMSISISNLNTATPFFVTLMFSKYFRRTYSKLLKSIKNGKICFNKVPNKHSLNETVALKSFTETDGGDVKYDQPAFAKCEFKSSNNINIMSVSIETIDLIEAETKFGQEHVSFQSEDL